MTLPGNAIILVMLPVCLLTHSTAIVHLVAAGAHFKFFWPNNLTCLLLATIATYSGLHDLLDNDPVLHPKLHPFIGAEMFARAPHQPTLPWTHLDQKKAIVIRILTQVRHPVQQTATAHCRPKINNIYWIAITVSESLSPR